MLVKDIERVMGNSPVTESYCRKKIRKSSSYAEQVKFIQGNALWLIYAVLVYGIAYI